MKTYNFTDRRFRCLAFLLLAALSASANGNPTTGPDDSIRVNPDTRGIDFSVYKRLKQLDREFEQYTRANGGYWSSGDAECVRITTEQRELYRDARKNDKLLNTVYEANPSAFDRLAELYSRILPQAKDARDYAMHKRESFMASANRNLASGKKTSDKGSLPLASESEPFIFAGLAPRFSEEQIRSVADFNRLENEIRKIYKDLPTSEAKSAFLVALGHAQAKLQLRQSQKALEAMANKIRSVTPGKDSEDSVVALLGPPTSRVDGNDLQLIKYRFDALAEDDLPAIEQNILSMLLTGSIIPEEYSGARKRDFVVAEIISDGFRNVVCVSVTKFDGQTGSATEVYRSGEKPELRASN